MKLRRLVVQGFRQFRDGFEMDFAPGAFFILGRNLDDPRFTSNGAGKTSFVAALAWVLFGRLHTGAAKDRVISHGLGEVSVEAHFDTGLIIKRSKKRGSRHSEALSYFHNGEWQEGDYAAQQAALTALLGVPDVLFFNCIWISRESETVQFLKAKPAPRMEILEHLLHDLVYTKARTVAERRRKAMDDEFAKAKFQYEQLTRGENEAQERLVSAQSQYQEAAARVSDRRRRNATRLGEIQTTLAEVDKQIQHVTAEDDMALRHEMGKVAREIQEINRKVAEASHRAGAHLSTACPTCKRAYDPSDIEQVRLNKTQAEADLKRLTDERRDAEARRREIEERLISVNTSRGRVADLEARRRDLRKEMAGLQDTADVDNALAGFKRTIEEAKVAIIHIQKEKASHEQTMHRLGRVIPYWKFWEQGFSSKGIRTLLMDDIRSILSHYVGLYAHALAGDLLRVEFPQSSSGFEIVVHGPDGPQALEELSTGEVWRTNLVVLLALRKALQYLHSTDMSLLFLDDATGTLDDAGERAIVELADQLADEFDLVFVTLPRDNEMIPRNQVITVERRDRESKIILEVA